MGGVSDEGGGPKARVLGRYALYGEIAAGGNGDGAFWAPDGPRGVLAHGRDQAAAPSVCEGSRVRIDVPRRGSPRRAHPASERRGDPRRGGHRGRAVLGDGVRAGRVALEADPLGPQERQARAAAGGDGHHGRRAARAARGPRGQERARRGPRDRAPRRVAPERARGHRRQRARARLRRRQGCDAGPVDPGREDEGEDELHGSGAAGR